MRLVPFLLLALSLCGAGLSEPIDEARARQLFVEYLRKQGQSPDDFGITIKPFGKGTRFIRASRKGMSPPGAAVYVMNRRGEIQPLTIDSLTIAYLNEWPPCPTADERLKLIAGFIAHHAGAGPWRREVVQGTGSIPGYAKSPLDEDLGAAVRPPLSFTDPKGRLIHVVYTYQRIGGYVHRYRLRFSGKGDFELAWCTEFGRDVGDAQYLE